MPVALASRRGPWQSEGRKQISAIHHHTCRTSLSRTAPAVVNADLWIRIRVPDICNLPYQHHGMIFMHEVVAVHRIPAEEIAEPEEKMHRVIELDPHHVFSRCLYERRRRSVPGQDLEFFEMDVDRMLPAARAVHQDPVFNRILSDFESRRVAVGESAVDSPHPIISFEIECPGNNR